ncbi:MAG: hypothetical protein JWO79_606 [Actinomycetia bacterium]|jgi:hypothetical protein|nr:hypothetical protein [Actinomycetes bacterium]MDQ1653038.1 hypothetical protein [Cryptosporangiaceae bacterium]MDQ1655420.1 hypothetical protein [Cryptosporangiaceae bacterium]
MKITGGLLAALGVLVLLVTQSDHSGDVVQWAAVAIVGALFAVGGLVVVSLQQIREALAERDRASREAAL